MIRAADLFCGAGGTSTGLALACKERSVDVDLVAVNHWKTAVETHARNHPWARHCDKSLENPEAAPRVLVPGGRLQILTASPECTNHSIACGGRPLNEQSRATASYVTKWAQELYIENILVENVKEFRDWGPLGANNRPLKSRKGETYKAWLNMLASLGYRIEERLLNAADYGAATSRVRLFIQARRGNRKISWPSPTHSADGGRGLFGETKKHRGAAEIIDWTLRGESIFRRKKPLARNTMRRIAAGLQKFGGAFIVHLKGTDPGQLDGSAKSVEKPLGTITAKGGHWAVCEPFILQQQSGGAPRSTKDPLPTVATKGAIAMVQPFLVPYYGERKGQEPRTHDVNAPLPTVVTNPKFGLVQPFIIPLNHGKDDLRSHSLDRPMPTITSVDAWALIQPFILHYYGNSKTPHDVKKPLATVTTHDRFALVQPVKDGLQLDILFRMLRPHELAAAMGFPADYWIAGTRSEQVEQIGNAVEVNQAKALCGALIA